MADNNHLPTRALKLHIYRSEPGNMAHEMATTYESMTWYTRPSTCHERHASHTHVIS